MILINRNLLLWNILCLSVYGKCRYIGRRRSQEEAVVSQIQCQCYCQCKSEFYCCGPHLLSDGHNRLHLFHFHYFYHGVGFCAHLVVVVVVVDIVAAAVVVVADVDVSVMMKKRQR